MLRTFALAESETQPLSKGKELREPRTRSHSWAVWILCGSLNAFLLLFIFYFQTECSGDTILAVSPPLPEQSETSSQPSKSPITLNSDEPEGWDQYEEFKWDRVVRTDSLLTKTFPEDTVIPGPSENWEFLITSAIILPRTSSILITSVCEYNFGPYRRKDTTIRVHEEAPQELKDGVFKILDIPFDDITTKVKKNAKCKDFKFVGQHNVGINGTENAGICPWRHYCHPYYCWREVIKDPECDHEQFAMTKGSFECMCGINKCEIEDVPARSGAKFWPEASVHVYRIAPENAWECVLIDYDISVMVEWGPHKAAVGGLTKDVFHKINCNFDKMPYLLKTEDYIHVGLRKHGQPNYVAKFHISTKIRLHGHIIPEYVPSDPDPENPLVSRVDPGYLLPNFPRMSLCIGGMYGGVMTYLIENVVHHMNLGFSHVYIGFDEPMESERFANMTRALQYFINMGHLTLISTKMQYLQWGPASYMKEQFYDYCLYLGKLKNELIMVVDIDEFVTPYTFEPLPIVLRRFLKVENQDVDTLCAVTFSPTDTERAPGFKFTDDPGWIGDRLPWRIREEWRKRNGKEVRKKSIFYAKNVFMGGTHVPGACNTTSIWDYIISGKSKGAYYVDIDTAEITHVRYAMPKRQRWKIAREEDKRAIMRSEYNSFWGQYNKKAMCWLFQTNRVNYTYFQDVTSRGPERRKVHRGVLPFEWDCSEVDAERPTWDR